MKGIGRIRKALGAVRRWFRPGAAILMYHRIAHLTPDTYHLAVSPAHFAEHLNILRRTCVPMPLVDLIGAVIGGTLPNRAVAITFDDGYYDNLSQAYPLLQAASIPATVFVVSDRVGSMREFWWDDLERLLLVPESTPAKLCLSLNATPHCWPTVTLQERAEAHRALHAMISLQTSKDRIRILDELAAWSGMGAEGRPTHRSMIADELLRLEENGLVQIGGHTVSHPVLSVLPIEEQYDEIVAGRRMLEAILRKPIRTFAYPYGRASDWTDATAQLVKEAGLFGAVTTIPGFVEAGDDPFRLRRWAVSDWDGDQFARALESFFVLR